MIQNDPQDARRSVTPDDEEAHTTLAVDDALPDRSGPDVRPPAAGKSVSILGVRYTHFDLEAVVDLYVTEFGRPFTECLLPENHWSDREWCKQHSRRLSGTSSIYRVTTKPANGKQKEIVEDVVTRQCEPEFLAEVTRRVQDEKIDAVLSLGCGVGVNMLAEKLEEVPVYPGLNTECFGGTAEPGTFVEMCAGCGECVLHLTGGICPVARCSKSILNGPCGGTNEGKCEVSPDIDCAWALIVDRMKKLGTLDQLYKVVDAKDWSTSHSGGPRRVVNDIPRPIAPSDE